VAVDAPTVQPRKKHAHGPQAQIEYFPSLTLHVVGRLGLRAEELETRRPANRSPSTCLPPLKARQRG
jgi:hypothetical protein